MTVLLMNIPLMVLAFGLMVGIPLWMVLRRPSWHGKPDTNEIPAYIVRQRREAAVPRQRTAQPRRFAHTITDW